MKIRKEALRAARLLLKATVAGGRVDQDKARGYVQRIIEEKPRYYVQILEAFQKLLRLELDKRHAIVESAEEVTGSVRDQLLNDLRGKFGPDLTSEFKVNPALLGGTRVKVGSTIWDGSVRSRLDTLRQAIGA